jgi:hypothetical protein
MKGALRPSQTNTRECAFATPSSHHARGVTVYRPGMNSSGPWWAIPAFTLGGVLLTLLVTVWLDHRKGRRETAARLVERTRESVYRWTERKLDLYSRHLKSCHDLRDLDVWPGSSSQPLTATGSLIDAIARSATEIVFIAPARVSGPAQRAGTTARTLADLIEEIRGSSKPGHQGRIDERFRERHADAARTFACAVVEFVAAARSDADIDLPAQGADLTR